MASWISVFHINTGKHTFFRRDFGRFDTTKRESGGKTVSSYIGALLLRIGSPQFNAALSLSLRAKQKSCQEKNKTDQKSFFHIYLII